MQMVKGKPGFQPKQYIPDNDANALGKLMGHTEQQVNMVSTIMLGHLAALPPEEGLMVGAVIAEGAITAKTSGQYEFTAWNLLPPGAAATDPPILVKDETSFKKLIDVGYTFVSESTAKVQVGVQ